MKEVKGWSQKKVVLFPELRWVNIFYHSPARTVEFVSEYIHLISKKKQTSKKKKQEYKKCKRKENISGKSIKKNKFAAARLNNFLVARISGKKNILFFGLGDIK